MKYIKDVEQPTVKELIDGMTSNRVCLPDFQRDFVWSPEQMAKLLESILRGYPIGTILMLDADRNRELGTRSFLGPDAPVGTPERYVIDGQQRLMTFLRLVRSPTRFEPSTPEEWQERLYKVFFKIDTNLRRLIADVDKPSFVVPHRVEIDEKADYNWHRKDRMIPVEFLGRPKLIEQWARVALAKHKHRNRTRLVKRLAAVGEKLLKYECPVEVLSGKLSPRDHANMFSLLNVGGTDLTIFDLLVARLSPDNINLRSLWRETQLTYPEINRYDIDPVYILKVVSLIAQSNAREHQPTCRKSDLAWITSYYNTDYGSIRHQFEGDWRRAARFLAKALGWLKSDGGVCQRKYVPYAPMLVTLAASLWWVEEFAFIDRRFQSRVHHKLTRWYWGSILGLAYQSRTDGVIAEHFGALKMWLNPRCHKRPPAVYLPTAKSEVEEAVDAIESTGDSRYKAVLCLPFVGHARDIYSNDYLPDARRGELHDHHIYPAAFLAKEGWERESRNQVANRMLITAQTNGKIRDDSPYSYLAGLNGKVLRKHFLFPEICRERMSYERFIRERQSRIVERLWSLVRHGE